MPIDREEFENVKKDKVETLLKKNPDTAYSITDTSERIGKSLSYTRIKLKELEEEGKVEWKKVVNRKMYIWLKEDKKNEG